MSGLRTVSSAPDARVLLVSWRALRPLVSRALPYEVEDVFAAVDEVDVVAPEASEAPSGLAYKLGRLGRRVFGPGRAGSARPLVDRRYELVFVHCQGLADLLHLGDPRRWTACAERGACCVEELWRWQVPLRTGEIERLAAFDAVFLGLEGSVDEVARATGRPAFALPAAVDALRSNPYPDPPARSIDVLSYGRRSDTTHRALLRWAEAQRRFYHYDTWLGNEAIDTAEHRRHTVDLLQRSRFVPAYPARAGHEELTRGQEELGYRFFEAAAAGAVMLGQLPATPLARELFGWEGAVLDLPHGSPEAGARIEALERDPVRLEALRRRNVRGSLLANDAAHRWRAVLGALDLPPSDRLAGRLEALGAAAAALEALPAPL